MTNSPEFSYALPVVSNSMRRTTTAWLILALIALVGAGLFSLLLVLSRTPVIQEIVPFLDFFRVALVVHVTLSVLIWLLAMSAATWSLSTRGDKPVWDRLSFWLAALGTAVIIVSPFVGAGDPLMNNYVPVLQHPLFYGGLVLFTLGILSHLLRAFLFRQRISEVLSGTTALQTGITLSAMLTGLSIVAVLASWRDLPNQMDGSIYFEFLFWGGGHVVQFSYTLLMMIAWVVLATASGCRFELTPRLTLVFLVFLALPVITVPFLYLAHDVTTTGHRLAFTELMKYGGLSCLPLGLAVAASLWRAGKPSGEHRYLRAALVSSLLLFAVGGILGFMIAGLDIVIPAHYHGATVGVTIAFMGLTYYLLPRLGFGALPERLATWQPYLYGGGQLLHIIGLAWSGGYGVQRKTAGVAQGLDGLGQTAGMGLMGLGGLISVIGGLMFLIVAYKSMRRRSGQ
ncbi:MAG: cbb3-type cytochrome c oxidase subunit I [Gammaproteobacteria bacterium]|nr:cbb3-type cytochrome c oxidase subunit I [Gammaproteobacteria bacterium]MDH5260301.1 cbb3-type cytochrome c oxidase subunit I [Gammaproteobacteria bacterium]MDH5583475.1 cbb3-type cytochrome c oxidase subunit I [Gammaproteobacteria bacterium]